MEDRLTTYLWIQTFQHRRHFERYLEILKANFPQDEIEPSYKSHISLIFRLLEREEVAIPEAMYYENCKLGNTTAAGAKYCLVQLKSATVWYGSMCTLSCFIKQAERGQLEARSIASPCMFFRVIVTAVEQFVSILLECNNESAVGKNSV